MKASTRSRPYFVSRTRRVALARTTLTPLGRAVNGTEILSAENMFQTYRYVHILPSILVLDHFPQTLTAVARSVDVARHLVPTGTNTLVIVFQSAFIKGKIIEEEHLGKDKHYALWNGDASRMWVRKAGYNYSWDWGPMLMTGALFHTPLHFDQGAETSQTAGPWRPIRLESYTSRLTSLCVATPLPTAILS